jgi:hypothetical protein
VAFASADGTASAPADYTAVSGTLTFDPGETSQTVSVAIQGDAVDEADETFTVVLSNAVAASRADGSGTGTIVDDDAPAGDAIDLGALPDSVDIDAICPPGRKQRGTFTGQITFAEPGRATFRLFAEFRKKRKRGHHRGHHHGRDDYREYRRGDDDYREYRRGHHHGREDRRGGGRYGDDRHDGGGYWARASGGWRTKKITFRLGMLKSSVPAGAYELSISINRRRCHRLRYELAKAGNARGTLVLTVKQRTDDGDRVFATERIAITS